MKKIGLFLTFLIVIINNSYAQIELNPNSTHRLNVKAVGSGDLWGVFGTTSTTSTNMVFRSGISNTNNWQNTGTITGVLGYSGAENMGIKLASYYKDLGLYGIEKLRFGTNGDFSRMVMLENGNIGVNLPSLPVAKFQVYRTGDAATGWGGYVSSLKAGMMVDGTHLTTNDNFDAVGIAGHGNNAKRELVAAEFLEGKRNIGVLGTAGNTGLENIGVYGHTEITDGYATGVKAYAKSDWGSIGLDAYASHSGNFRSIGVNAVADGPGSGVKYGIYAEAMGAGLKYAGYFAGDVKNTGFTQLGSNAPKIKVKKITGFTQTTQDAYRAIPHGLALDKILSVEVIVSASSTVKHFKKWTAYDHSEFDYYVDPTYVRVLNIKDNSSSILNKPLTIYITYEE